MSIAPENIQVGQCYLTVTGQVRRVMRILPDGRVQYEARGGAVARAFTRRTDIQDLRSFAFSADWPVPCDWTLEKDEIDDAGRA
jgi:predicted NUDIX family NTP pyrophosphohydrolase